MTHEEQLLKKYFGYETFRPGQEKIISNILLKKDVLGIMPTGAGKSICYQIPALILPGITLVISPLISLMKDQVDSLNQIGISSTYINSSLSSKEYSQTIENIKHNLYKIIYIAPERLNSDNFIHFISFLNISMITIDESHCVSQWGHDFRPSYLTISDVISKLNTRPIISAFTATATDNVKKDIIQLLNLDNPFVLTTGFDRKNLKFCVQNTTEKMSYILDYLNNHKNQSGIIYCSTRKNVEKLYEKLLKLGYSVSKYHGGMDEKERAENQNNFVFDKSNIMIATNAFGMGIDKSNVRFVIHYNMPKDLESYYQEAGRAGRDGDNSECILLFSRSDIVTNKFIIEQSPSKNNQKIEYTKLNDMIDYCNTDKCLRKCILEYFGEFPTFSVCHNCSNCLSTTELTDITQDAQKILSCIYRMKELFGIGLVSDVLKGSKSAKISKLHLNELSTYGILKDYTKDTIKDLIYFLITEGYLKTDGTKYPILRLCSSSSDILLNRKKIMIKKKIEKIVVEPRGIFEELEYDANLFEILRALRKKIAKANNVPPFIIFSDMTLKQIAKYIPMSKDEMLKINGVGLYKYNKFGNLFINELKRYTKKT